jgi:hypothetical protein
MTSRIRNNTKGVKKRNVNTELKKRNVKANKISVKTLRLLAWRLTSIYIRLRDADQNGICTCSTCKYQGFYYKSKIQAGHFVKKSCGNLTEYLEQNIHAQCAECNLKDEQFLMGIYINKKYEPCKGLPYAEYLYFVVKPQKIKKDKKFYESLINERKKQILELAKQKNLWEWKEGLPKYVFD